MKLILMSISPSSCPFTVQHTNKSKEHAM